MRAGRSGLAIFALLAAAGAAFAHGGATGIVKERMDAMSEIGDQMKLVGGMIKGGTYDAAQVSAAGGTIASHAGSALVELFPEGSLQAPTEASPAIWTDWATFQASASELEEAALALEGLADKGAGRAEIAPAFRTLAETCKTCHQSFRIKK
jgi:cytochrome c556